MKCNMCPRKCGVDRTVSNGYCGVADKVKIAKAYLHMWEEPVITGENGSGTIFFSGCNLKCVYCQNFDISHECKGVEITISELSEIFKKLESMGASNINLVTPSHYARQIREALDIYRPNIPIVYNSSGYDSLEELELLKDYIDIYLVDFKYWDEDLSVRLSKARDYRNVAIQSILKMKEYKPINIYDGDILKSGVIIRHMILPNHIEDSKKILEWISKNVSNPCVSLMGQYTPMYKASEYKDINRKLKPIEYKIVEKYMLNLGIKDGFTQDLTSAVEEYVPDFKCDILIDK